MEGMSEAIESVQEWARLGLGFSVDGGPLTSTFFWRRSGLRREEVLGEVPALPTPRLLEPGGGVGGGDFACSL